MIYTQPAETNSTDTLIKHADSVLATPESAGLRDADTQTHTRAYTHTHRKGTRDVKVSLG